VSVATTGMRRPTDRSAGAGWRVAAALLVLSLIPLSAGALRLVQLSGGPEIIPADDRFAGFPAALVVHILGSLVFALLGLLQLVAPFRRRHRAWHRRAGRVVALAGLAVCGSALWLTLGYEPQPGTGPVLFVTRLVVGPAMAVFLAALGIFGVLSYSVVQRSREIGIRVALGAHPQDVLRMVLGHAAGLALVGVLVGLAGALALSRAIRSLLFELSPTDPLTLGSMAVLLGAVALLASYLPARRATRVDPLIALRSE